MERYLSEFNKYYKQVKEKCTLVMQEYNDNLKNIQDNDIVKKAIDNFTYLNSDGKFLRASLIALGYQSIRKDDAYLPLALALEIFQTSVLIHDDIIDKATKRRGKTTIPLLYQKEYNLKNIQDISNSMAICTGDLGFFLANQLLLEKYQNNTNLAKVLTYYNEIVIKTIKGEMIDVFLPFKEENKLTTSNLENNIIQIYTLKTAWYTVIGPFCLGLTLAGAPSNLIKKYEDILLNVGIAFQIKDDLLGVFSTEDVIGKTSSDVKEFKQTLLYSYTINTKYKEELLKYYGTDNIKKVQEIFVKSCSKKYVETKMHEYFQQVKNELKDIKKSETNILLGFIEYLEQREK